MTPPLGTRGPALAASTIPALSVRPCGTRFSNTQSVLLLCSLPTLSPGALRRYAISVYGMYVDKYRYVVWQRYSLLYLPTDIHALFVNKHSSNFLSINTPPTTPFPTASALSTSDKGDFMSRSRLYPFEYGTNGVNGPNFKGENKV